jgi:hypothetical protein
MKQMTDVRGVAIRYGRTKSHSRQGEVYNDFSDELLRAVSLAMTQDWRQRPDIKWLAPRLHEWEDRARRNRRR